MNNADWYCNQPWYVKLWRCRWNLMTPWWAFKELRKGECWDHAWSLAFGWSDFKQKNLVSINIDPELIKIGDLITEEILVNKSYCFDPLCDEIRNYVPNASYEDILAQCHSLVKVGLVKFNPIGRLELVKDEDLA